jgi:hypothetical protein
LLSNSGLKWVDASSVLSLVAEHFQTDTVAKRFAHDHMHGVIVKLIDMTVNIQGRQVSWYDLKQQWVDTERSGADLGFVYKENVGAFRHSLQNCARICAMSLAEGNKVLLPTVALLLDPNRKLYFDVERARPRAYMGVDPASFTKDIFDHTVPVTQLCKCTFVIVLFVCFDELESYIWIDLFVSTFI